MKVRRIIIDEDYPLIKTWWESRGSDAPQKEIFPIGVIAEQDGFPVACGFLYEDKLDRVGMVEWEATNPDCHSAMQALRGLNMIFDFFEKYWCVDGSRILMSWVAQGRGDGRILDRRGWKKCPGERHELMAFSNFKAEELCQR